MTQPDTAFLRSKTRPDYELLPDPIVVADLFSGCGGLTLGLAEAARRQGRGIDVALAVDSDPDIVEVYAHNFPKANARARAVEDLFDGEPGESPTPKEVAIAHEIDRLDWLVGGPPCQGHSDLNNHTRRDDPRNGFYLRMARAAAVLRPSVVLIENVPAVVHDRGRVVEQAKAALETIGYRIADTVTQLSQIGVPQRRRRHTLLALRDVPVEPDVVLDKVRRKWSRDIRWAIGDLESYGTDNPLDQPSSVSKENHERIQWLMEHKTEFNLPDDLRPECHQDGDHSYRSMYGRLKWDEPAQTITTGFSSMGQGRYVHPSCPRTLTPHEAARLQYFPDWFDFTRGGIEMRRRMWATMIGNAVPPKLTIELGRILLPHMVTSG